MYGIHRLFTYISAIVILHVIALHIVGSNNPSGIEPKDTRDTVTFHPYTTAKDIVGMIAFATIFAAMLFFLPNALGHPDN